MIRSTMVPLVLVCLCIVATARAQHGSPPPGYAVVVSKATMQDASWMRVVEAIVSRHDADVVPFEGAVKMARAGLVPAPGRTAFVLRPVEVDEERLDAIRGLTRSLDKDPYTDTCWGVVTGPSAEAALRRVTGGEGSPPAFGFDARLFAANQGEGAVPEPLSHHAGDPGAASNASGAWRSSLSREGDVFTLTVVASRASKPRGTIMHWLPERLVDVEVLEGRRAEPLVTDCFVLLRGVDAMTEGQRVVVRFRGRSASASSSLQKRVSPRLAPMGPRVEADLERVLRAIVEAGDEDVVRRVREALAQAGENRPAIEESLRRCPPSHRRDLAALVASMPPSDLKTLSARFLLDNLAHAEAMWSRVPWRSTVPRELFVDHVLPYANVNEARHPWRDDFRRRFGAVLEEAKTPSQAMARLNVDAFKAFGVRYHPSKRPKPDQSPRESAAAGYASCTGLSIMLIDACRAIGVPARFVGTPRWTSVRGNHSWVEVFDREWLVIGACEPGEPNRTWFMGRAAAADPEVAMNRIYAVDWRGGDRAFPLVWARGFDEVRAIDVTPFYTQRRRVTVRVDAPDGERVAFVTLRQNGRIVAHLRGDDHKPVTLAGPARYEAEVRLTSPTGTRSVRVTAETTAEAEQVLRVRAR